ncbi:hypothetical protein J6590_084624 [Homalodisca vitripennis]|nr:hypothetical protein J6590_084624 [Homalodisca vitripennis]
MIGLRVTSEPPPMVGQESCCEDRIVQRSPIQAVATLDCLDSDVLNTPQPRPVIVVDTEEMRKTHILVVENYHEQTLLEGETTFGRQDVLNTPQPRPVIVVDTE